MVEGDGENILLPTIAELIGRPLEDYGVSVVNIGNLAYKRYARIYRARHSGAALPVKVACVTDLDIWPDKAEKRDDNPIGFKEKKEPGNGKRGNLNRWKSYYDSNTLGRLLAWKANKAEQDGDNVKTFISEEWTFEYCLARHGLARLVYEAVSGSDGGFDELSDDAEERAIQIYGMIENKSSGKTEATYKLAALLNAKYKDCPDDLRRSLPPYIVNAITHVTAGFPAEVQEESTW